MGPSEIRMFECLVRDKEYFVGFPQVISAKENIKIYLTVSRRQRAVVCFSGIYRLDLILFVFWR